MLTIDSAEADYRKTMLARIAKRLGQEHEIKPARADISHGDKFGLELKRPGDFISSIQDGRLFQQANDLTSYERAAILIEGTLPDVMYARRGMSVPSVLGAVYSVALRQGIPIQFTHSVQSGFFELHLDAAMRQGLEEGIPGAALARKKASPRDMALALLASLPGIGWERAKRILEHHINLQTALANVDDWHQIDGIGKKTAENCSAFLSTPSQELLA